MPLDPVTGALVNTGIQQAGGFLGDLWGIMNQAGQREHQYQMTDYLYDRELEQWNRQNAYNREMWDLQNQYNSPAAQMQRYKDAGLNPNLIYGQGSPGLSSPIPQAAGPQAKGEAQNTFKHQNIPIDFMGQVMQYKVQDQQLKNLEQQRLNAIKDGELKHWDVLIKAKEAGFKDEEIEQLRKEYFRSGERYEQEKGLWKYQSQAAEFNVEKIKAEINKYVEEANLTVQQRKKIEKELEYWLQTGINIEKSPWWLQMIIGFLYNNEIIQTY